MKKVVFILVLAALAALFSVTAGARELRKGILVVTCDDGHVSQRNILSYILYQKNIVATCYPVTYWTYGGGQYMDHWQLQELKRIGWEFGNHTYSHIDPLSVSDTEFALQLLFAERDLKGWGLLGPTKLFAPPFGSFGSRTIEVIKYYGYTSLRQGFTAGSDVNIPDTFDPFRLNVVNWKSDTDPSAIIAWLDKLANEKAAGVCVIQKVDVPDDPDSITSDTANQVFTYAAGLVAEGKLEALTVSKMIERMRPNISGAVNLLLLQ